MYKTPWGPRELPDDEANQLQGQVPGGLQEMTEAEVHEHKVNIGEVEVTEGPNPGPDGDSAPATGGKVETSEPALGGEHKLARGAANPEGK